MAQLILAASRTMYKELIFFLDSAFSGDVTTELNELSTIFQLCPIGFVHYLPTIWSFCMGLTYQFYVALQVFASIFQISNSQSSFPLKDTYCHGSENHSEICPKSLVGET